MVAFDRATEWIIDRDGSPLLQRPEAMSDAELNLLRDLGTIEQVGAWSRGLPFEHSWEANEAIEADDVDDPPPPYTRLPAATVLQIANPHGLTGMSACTGADNNRARAVRLASIQLLQDTGSDRTANQVVARLARPAGIRQAEHQQLLMLRAIPPPCPRGGVMHFTGEPCSRCRTRIQTDTSTPPSVVPAETQATMPANNLELLPQLANEAATIAPTGSKPSSQT